MFNVIVSGLNGSGRTGDALAAFQRGLFDNGACDLELAAPQAPTAHDHGRLPQIPHGSILLLNTSPSVPLTIVLVFLQRSCGFSASVSSGCF